MHITHMDFILWVCIQNWWDEKSNNSTLRGHYKVQLLECFASFTSNAPLLFSALGLKVETAVRDQTLQAADPDLLT